MIKNGSIQTGFIRNNMFVMKLYETLKLYKDTIEYLSSVNNESLINDIKNNCITIHELYKLHCSELLSDAIIDNAKKNDLELNQWLDYNINTLLSQILGDDYDK